MNTTEKITADLYADNRQLINQFVSGKIGFDYFTEKYDVSRQYLHQLFTEGLRDNIMDAREKHFDRKMHEFYDEMQQGIPIEILMDDAEFSRLIPESGLKSHAKLRENIVRRFRTNDMFDEKSDFKFVMLNKKLSAYVNKIQIGRELERYNKEHHIAMLPMARHYRASYQKVYGIKKDMEYFGTPLPHLPKELILVIERNIDICLDKRSGKTIAELSKAYDTDNRLITRIIRAYDKMTVTPL